jgi:hypothetical protein
MRPAAFVVLCACDFHSPGAATDAPVSIDSAIDAAIDAPIVPFTCPAGYTTLAGGQAGSLYKVYGGNGTVLGPGPGRGTWLQAEAACRGDGPGIHLAIAESEGEHQAFVDVVSGASRWLGVTDRKTEGTWLPIIGGTTWVEHWLGGVPMRGTNGNCLLLTRVQNIEEDTSCAGEGSPPSSQWDKGSICECDNHAVDLSTF